eukprot:m.1229409 g.1229409  ORF g.1229409 m.1229409 type:complete len:126 (+) comp24652_c1_seq1:3276-3653(+)
MGIGDECAGVDAVRPVGTHYTACSHHHCTAQPALTLSRRDCTVTVQAPHNGRAPKHGKDTPAGQQQAACDSIASVYPLVDAASAQRWRNRQAWSSPCTLSSAVALSAYHSPTAAGSRAVACRTPT